jgi:hypothetical protein
MNFIRQLGAQIIDFNSKPNANATYTRHPATGDDLNHPLGATAALRSNSDPTPTTIYRLTRL